MVNSVRSLTQQRCARIPKFLRGADGRLMVDLVTEFVPQWVFYIVGAVTLSALFLLFGVDAFALARRMRRHTVAALVDV